MPLHSLSYPPKPVVHEDATTEKSTIKHTLIYFIPGNPGLIDYYAPFLAHLRELLDSAVASSLSLTSPSFSSTQFHIYGQDLAGFSDDDGHEPFTSSRKPFDLEYQIQLALKTVESLRVVKADDSSSGGSDRHYDEIILIGHSVGSYIALQLCHRALLHLRQERERDTSHHRIKDHHNHHHKLNKAILLFPTIVHIARSPSGKRLDTLRRIPGLGADAHLLARLFLAFWPRSALHWFVRVVMGFPAHAAEATTRWLGSRGGDGVWQALHMGMDEMQTIGDDAWDEELWGIEREAEAEAEAEDREREDGGRQGGQQQQQALTPSFYFFFGKNDHWVADHYRDIFIEKRQKQVERTKLIVDEGDLPHAFCIRHSETVAEKAYTWIQEMYSSG